MEHYAIRQAIHAGIQTLTAELAKLNKIMADLDSSTPSAKGPKIDLPLPKLTTKSRRLRLNDDTRKSITEKILKAAKAHKNGATKADIIKYLDTSGYKVGVNYNEQHMFAILSSLRGDDGAQITTTGQKAAMRYHAGR